ncbi:hypothetical protein SAMN07250955_103147 [Arboricoccus pini]|uniref:Lipoprotein n=1 Tax=Arboricoccus pini TaxID=1963835 RepID=A0A212QSL1_9PROT|nr:hypothetical protein [Arboricoccus pini]SNB62566.1 hypothetical protein SAMN07250955_103147 [Arboricoccus pini]
MSLSRWMPSIVAVSFLAACTHPTPYQAATQGEGYAERELETGRYRISFAGNAQTPKERVENYLLYRAAELTLQSGNDWFEMGERETTPSTIYQTLNDGFPGGYYGAYPYRGPFVGPEFTTSTTRPITSYTAYATILVRKGAKPADDINAYDARDVERRLGTSIMRDGADQDRPPAS